MTDFNVIHKPYRCRARDLLWFQEMRQSIFLIVQNKKTIDQIKELSKKENIFNAASPSRAYEIGCVIARRLSMVDEDYLKLFISQSIEMQKVLCVISIMLEDHTFFEFMDHVYKEKLICGDMTLNNSEFIGYLHGLQSRDERAAAWTDAAVRKLRDNFKAILRDGGLISKEGDPRVILRPFLNQDISVYLEDNGLSRVRKIFTGERS